MYHIIFNMAAIFSRWPPILLSLLYLYQIWRFLCCICSKLKQYTQNKQTFIKYCYLLITFSKWLPIVFKTLFSYKLVHYHLFWDTNTKIGINAGLSLLFVVKSLLATLIFKKAANFFKKAANYIIIILFLLHLTFT